MWDKPTPSYKGFVKGASGKWGVQVPSRRAKRGFLVFDTMEAFDGGSGFDKTWFAMPRETVPEKYRLKLGWILSEEGDL